MDDLSALFARAAGEVERYRHRPIQLQLSLSQLMLLGGLIGMATGSDEAAADMVDSGIELAHGFVAELVALECHGVAGIILASLPEKEITT